MQFTRRKFFFVLAILILASTHVQPKASAAPEDEIPAKVLEAWALLTQGSGTWITDNAVYKSDNEPYEAYGIHWEYGLGKKYLKGRLYGIIDGKDVGAFWEFTEFWDPASNQRRIIQIGAGGIVGRGTIWVEEDGSTKEEQTFTHLNGESFVVGHHAWMENNDHHTQSYDIVEGKWEKRRLYVWELLKDQATEG